MVIGSVMPLMSISWNASLPMSAAGTLPVIATIGTESSSAVPIPVTRFVAPGPDVPMHTPDPAGDAGVAVGGVGAALLVADEDVAQLRVVAEDVVERQDDAARVAEEDVDTLAQERLAEDVRPDAGPLELAALVEHLLAGALDRGGLGRAVARHVAAPRPGRGLGGFAGSVFVVIGSSRSAAGSAAGQTKDPRLPARVPSVFGGVGR